MSEKRKINWKTILAQGFVLSISIYVPFFLQNWYSDNQSNELNLRYKELLIEDLTIDIAKIDSMIFENRNYLDTATLIFITPSLDASGLLFKADKALMLGMTDDFYPITDIQTYIDQFRDHGDKNDLKLIQELGYLKVAIQKIYMIDKRREEYREQYYTPIYLNNYSIKNGFPEVTNLDYFNSDHFLNSVSLLFSLSMQTDVIYSQMMLQAKKIIEILNKK